MMKRCARLAAVFVLSTALLAGCGEAQVPDEIVASTVSISRKGKISAWLVEDFTEEYYSLSELSRMAVNEVEDFNGAGSGKTAAVKLKKVEPVSGGSGKVRICYRYDGWESYTRFNEDTLFYGTVEEAVQEGFEPEQELLSVSDSSLFAAEEVKQAADRYLIVTDVKANIYCSRKVTHISDGASVNEDGSIDTSRSEGTVYILME